MEAIIGTYSYAWMLPGTWALLMVTKSLYKFLSLSLLDSIILTLSCTGYG